ncbi:unnamed protein product [Clonostachys rhizophaga]|uniref:Uncharacterized protein n=1 Tax=Clonostachys rhizophaga TaxID=160324 RepID=A0A9N9V8J6_9HYPO|nr:unnamed protein product [Clonostachys rhizophaga]
MRDDTAGSSLTTQSLPNVGTGTSTNARMYRSVYILFQQDTDSTSIVEVFADVQDANNECLQQANSHGITLTNKQSTSGPDSHFFCPVEPLRWDTPEGLSCWVEGFDVVPKKIASPAHN